MIFAVYSCMFVFVMNMDVISVLLGTHGQSRMTTTSSKTNKWFLLLNDRPITNRDKNKRK